MATVIEIDNGNVTLVDGNGQPLATTSGVNGSVLEISSTTASRNSGQYNGSWTPLAVDSAGVLLLSVETVPHTLSGPKHTGQLADSQIPDSVTRDSELIPTITVVNTATYDLLVTDKILHVTYTATAAVTSLTLPTAQATSGRQIVIKDAAGNAGSFSITIDTEGAETIDGSDTYVMGTNYEAKTLYSDGNNWFIY